MGLMKKDFFPPRGQKASKGRTSTSTTRRRKGKRSYADLEIAIRAVETWLTQTCGCKYRFVQKWGYENERGEMVGFVCRFENPDKGAPSKEYRPISRHGKDWQIADPPGGFPLYKLPELLASKGPIFVTEGEKASDSLANLGLTATTAAHGAESAKKADWRPLEGREAILVPDNDPPKPNGERAGMQYVAAVRERLAKIDPAAVIKLLELPDLPPKGDAVEFVETQKEVGRSDGEIRDHILTLVEAASEWKSDPETIESDSDLPTVFLPGGFKHMTLTECAKNLGGLLGEQREAFQMNGAPVRLSGIDSRDPVVEQIRATKLPSMFEHVAQLKRTRKSSDDGVVEVPALCNRGEAELIKESRDFLDCLPPIRVVTRCPVILAREGELVVVSGYDEESGVYASNFGVEEISFDDAKSLILGVVQDFQFASPSDRSRAIAAILTPAFVHGQVLTANTPLVLLEADRSQTGKGYFAKVLAAVYTDSPVTVTQRKGGTGSLEESFSAALLQGRVFVYIDNVRGALDSPALESALTEDTFMARAPYLAPQQVSLKRTTVFLTSNRAELTVDLVNRSNPIRIRKRSEDYKFQRYPGDRDLLEHIRANQPLYLGAIFAVVREWWNRGRKRSMESKHSFRDWAQPLDWILQELFHEAPLCGGIHEVKARMTTPALNWLRDVAQCVTRNGSAGKAYRTAQLVQLMEDGGVEIPGLKDGDDLTVSDTAKRVHQATGKRLGQCFRSEAVQEFDDFRCMLEIDGFLVERTESQDRDRRSMLKEYKFSSDTGFAPMETPAAPIAANGTVHFLGEPASGSESSPNKRDSKKECDPIAAQPRIAERNQSRAPKEGATTMKYNDGRGREEAEGGTPPNPKFLDYESGNVP